MGTKRQTSRQKASSTAPKYCEIPFCGYTTITQKHRIKPGRDGGKYLLGNVIALCPTHHAEADRTLEGRIAEDQAGYLPPDLLYSLVLARIKRDHDAKLQLEESERRARIAEEEGLDTSSEYAESTGECALDADREPGSFSDD